MFLTVTLRRRGALAAPALLLCLAAALAALSRLPAPDRCTNTELRAAALLFDHAGGGAALRDAAAGDEKVAYLTFDDGPSKTTPQVLDTLAEYGVRATFFVCAADNNERYLPLLARTVREGHQVALHSSSHSYRRIYASTDAFWRDIDALKEKIRPYVGDAPLDCLRFPGGSTNTVSHKYGGSDIMKQLKEQAAEKGYRWFDWNVCAYDAVGGHPTAAAVLHHVIREAGDRRRIIVLMHDTGVTQSTAEALPEILRALAAQGYTFDVVRNYPRAAPPRTN